VTEHMGDQFSNVAGTSAGAIMASLVAAGYTAAELKDILNAFDYTGFRDPGPFDRILSSATRLDTAPSRPKRAGRGWQSSFFPHTPQIPEGSGSIYSGSQVFGAASSKRV
jgi:predicted acylesterase/phospholipase RssA